MYIKNYLFATAIAASLFASNAGAQTISTFDDLILPGTDTNFANTQDTGNYTFRSGDVLFYGELATWGDYIGFNYSNMQNDTTQNYTNDKSAITAIGVDSSANYGVCYVPLDFIGPNPTATLPVGAKLEDSAIGHPVSGAYFTNTTYAYWYMVNNFHSGNWFKLTVRGYLNGQKVPDSVNFMLANVTDSSRNIVNTWTWVDLTSLGNVDSLTFDLSSNDTAGGFGMNNPSYFAIDNLTTLDADTTSGNDSTGNGIAFLKGDLTFSIFPNPAQNEIFISSKNLLNIGVFDLSGKMILFQKQTRSLNIYSLSNGIYILKVWDKKTNKTGSAKFIKQ